MNLLDISGCRGQAGADRPDRLIGHHQIVGARRIRQRAVELPAADVEGLPGIALVLGFADADDRGEAGAPGGFRLLPDQHVALAMIGAPLGMADNDGAGAGIRQHFGRKIAGMGARRLGVAILRADRQASLSRAAFSAKAAIRVAGGQTSRSALAATPGAPASMASNSAMEALRPFIFQLPAISGRMASVISEFP